MEDNLSFLPIIYYTYSTDDVLRSAQVNEGDPQESL